jgi:aspartyl-tRNA(Asn)/glutamyl-tRNA(Gln) amidotransferase subunit B
LFNPDTGETKAMRTKEDSADYRYFPDPDLPPLQVDRAWVEDVRSQMAELPRTMAARFVGDYGIPEYDAITLTQSQAMAHYFESVAKLSGQAKMASNWIMGEVSRKLNASHLGFEACPLQEATLAAILKRVADASLSNNAAKVVLEELWDKSLDADAALAGVDAVIEQKGLKQINDTKALEKIIDTVLAANADQVEQIKAGKDKAFNALIGQVMKASQGKANPKDVNDLLRAKIAAV